MCWDVHLKICAVFLLFSWMLASLSTCSSSTPVDEVQWMVHHESHFQLLSLAEELGISLIPVYGIGQMKAQFAGTRGQRHIECKPEVSRRADIGRTVRENRWSTVKWVLLFWCPEIKELFFYIQDHVCDFSPRQFDFNLSVTGRCAYSELWMVSNKEWKRVGMVCSW